MQTASDARNVAAIIFAGVSIHRVSLRSAPESTEARLHDAPPRLIDCEVIRNHAG